MEFLEFDFRYTPDELLAFFQEEPFVFLLESSLQRTHWGRFSFLGFAPVETFRHQGPRSLDLLRQRFESYQRRAERKAVSRGLPFPAGMMGFLSYDLGLTWEGIHSRHIPGPGIPDCLFGFYDAVLTIDHCRQKLYVTSTGLPEKNFILRKKWARERLQAIAAQLTGFEQFTRLRRSGFAHRQKAANIQSWRSSFTKAQYSQAVVKALDYIRRGDIYQVNLSQRFDLRLDEKVTAATLIDVYQLLKQNSPACFGGYFDAGDFQIISSSPELFLRLRGDRVSTRPMKGTRPRGRNILEDQRYKKDLRHSPKDAAELLMITDLERNDLGRVCVPGSIRVQTMRTLETYKTVFQATSTVAGRLRPGEDNFSLLRAAFPGGSITGCPKIRSMQIIDELECSARGVYTGSLGYINFAGDMDINILIRTLLFKGQEIYFHVGGGIVADSKPLAEYQETLVKARAMQKTLRQIFLKRDS